jgi:hypothetical protein
LLEDPFGAFRFTSPCSDEPTLLNLPHQLLMTLLLQKEEEVGWYHDVCSSHAFSQRDGVFAKRTHLLTI